MYYSYYYNCNAKGFNTVMRNWEYVLHFSIMTNLGENEHNYHSNNVTMQKCTLILSCSLCFSRVGRVLHWCVVHSLVGAALLWFLSRIHSAVEGTSAVQLRKSAVNSSCHLGAWFLPALLQSHTTVRPDLQFTSHKRWISTFMESTHVKHTRRQRRITVHSLSFT